MGKRFLFLPVVLAVAVLLSPFHLSYIAFAIIGAIAILLFDAGMEGESYEPQIGYWFLAIGVMFLITAYFISSNYGISFEALNYDKSFPRLVRNLPYLGITSLSMGAIVVTKSLFNKP